MSGPDRKKVQQIANFIVNNITMAEVTSMVVEKAKETAEFIVSNDIAPDNFNSPVSRGKLYKKMTNLKEQVTEEKKRGWMDNIINKFTGETKVNKKHEGFNTGKKE